MYVLGEIRLTFPCFQFYWGLIWQERKSIQYFSYPDFKKHYAPENFKGRCAFYHSDWHKWHNLKFKKLASESHRNKTDEVTGLGFTTLGSLCFFCGRPVSKGILRVCKNWVGGYTQFIDFPLLAYDNFTGRAILLGGQFWQVILAEGISVYIWLPWYKKYVETVERVQRTTIKIIRELEAKTWRTVVGIEYVCSATCKLSQLSFITHFSYG